jgi:lantibiotic protection ABC transporter MutG family permease subunit
VLTLIRCIRSDCLKLRRTFMLPIHFIAPALVSVLFLAYYSVSPWKTESKLSGFLEFIAVSFPLIIGLISAKSIEQEGQAGSFQNMLCGIKSRSIVYLSKLILLFVLGSISVLLAVGIFGTFFKVAPAVFYLKAIGILIISNVFLYVLHQFVSLQFGPGASIGLGIAESLISALALTGLGDGKWYFIPCTWGARLCDYLVYIWSNPVSFAMGNAEIVKGILIAGISSTIAIIASIIWFRNWGGRKTYD